MITSKLFISPKKKRINILFILFILIFASCTKTKTEPYAPESKAKIKSFKIINSSEDLPTSIDHYSKTITVTIPPGIYLTTLEPKVELEEGCTLKSGSDTLITQLQSYFINGRKIEYPVTYKDGDTQTYSLIIKTYQPPLNFLEVSIDSKNPVEFDQSKWHITKALMVKNQNAAYPYSKNYDLDLSLGKASLIDEKGKEYEFSVVMSQYPPITSESAIVLNLNDINGRFVDGKYTQTPAAGLYWIKIRYYDREEKLKNPIKITY